VVEYRLRRRLKSARKAT